MAEFAIAYNRYVKPIEGGYSNVLDDKGGETYAGISRIYNPMWKGWGYIDSVKKKRSIKHNEKFPDIDYLVSDFYNTLWTKNNFGLINSQEVANISFDWFVNSGYNSLQTKNPETYGIDEILNVKFGHKLPADFRFDTATINAINKTDSAKLHTAIKAERLKFYQSLLKNPSQQKFAGGWLARLSKFPDLETAINTGVILTFAALLFVLLYSK